MRQFTSSNLDTAIEHLTHLRRYVFLVERATGRTFTEGRLAKLEAERPFGFTAGSLERSESIGIDILRIETAALAECDQLIEHWKALAEAQVTT
jgi:hypothetical protein